MHAGVPKNGAPKMTNVFVWTLDSIAVVVLLAALALLLIYGLVRYGVEVYIIDPIRRWWRR